MTREQFAVRDELVSEEEIIILDKEVIDLDESVEDNILLAIPMQLLSEDEQQSTEMPHGSGWEVITEETFQERAAQKANETIDPRLAKLSELFGDSNDPDDDKA